MVATNKKSSTSTTSPTSKKTATKATTEPQKELKLKKVKKNKKPSAAVPSIIAANEGTSSSSSSSSVVIADGGGSVPKEKVKKQPRIEINMDELEAKERLDAMEIQPLTVTQLKYLCKARKIAGYSGKRKEQIMNLLVPAVV